MGRGQGALKDAAMKEGGALFNSGTQFARDRLNKQLSFFRAKSEVDEVASLLAQTKLMTMPMPELPKVPAIVD